MVAIASYLGVMLSSKLHQEHPRPGVAGGTRVSKLPSLGFSPSKYLKAALGGTNGENSRNQFGSAGVPWFTNRLVTTCFVMISADWDERTFVEPN